MHKELDVKFMELYNWRKGYWIPLEVLSMKIFHFSEYFPPQQHFITAQKTRFNRQRVWV